MNRKNKTGLTKLEEMPTLSAAANAKEKFFLCLKKKKLFIKK